MMQAYRPAIKRLTIILAVILMLPAVCMASADQIFQENNDAVVVIRTFDRKGKPIGQGSGFIISNEGAIVTNFHVIDGAKKITVKIGGKSIKVDKVLSKDKANDLAVLKVKRGRYTVVTLGSIRDVSIGESVYVIGSPSGLENTISDGILSGLREMTPGKRVLQITAPISPGSSGGPVFNENGSVIGVVTFQLTKAQNLNFAMPIDLINYSTGVNKGTKKAAVPKPAPAAPAVKKPGKAIVSSGPSSLKFTTDNDSSEKETAEEAERWFKMGVAYGKSGMHREEINAYKKAVELDPGHSKAYYNLGIAYSYLGIYQEAVNSYKEAVRINPSYTNAIYNLSLTYLNTGNRDAALYQYNKLKTIEPALSDKLISLINRQAD